MRMLSVSKLPAKEEVTLTKLREIITKARSFLRAMKKQHSGNCQFELDPRFYGPVCTCGAGSHNTAIDKALEDLSL
jgi:ribosomal protein L10